MSLLSSVASFAYWCSLVVYWLSFQFPSLTCFFLCVLDDLIHDNRYMCRTKSNIFYVPRILTTILLPFQLFPSYFFFSFILNNYSSCLLCCSAYGEAIFLAVQTVIIAFLVLTYTRGATVGVIYTAVYAAILAYLLSPMAPMSLLWALQASVMFLVVMARVSHL